MVTKAFSSAVYGVNASIVSIEVGIVQGTKFFMVGLPDVAVKESQQRIESVLKHAGYAMPRQKVIVNLAPADIKKEGAAYDLAIALCILQSSKQENLEGLSNYLVLGELSLDGFLRSVRGALPIALEASKSNFKGIILPASNANEAAVVSSIDVIPINHISEAIDFFKNTKKISPVNLDPLDLFSDKSSNFSLDFCDVQGQMCAKRALEVAAAGGHNVIMIGSPGSGKTMLAKRIPSILPPFSIGEALETTKVYSVVGKLSDLKSKIITTRPFRDPHHTVSDVALVGGGCFPQPGEISLAHNGVLFLDELPEFKRAVLEVMRQPMEERKVTISRAKFSVEFPANFMLVASMNPCPCGYYTHPDRECNCDLQHIKRYVGRVSGPLMDRIDLHVAVAPVSFNDLRRRNKSSVCSSDIRSRVIKARELQIKRFSKYEELKIYSNALMPSSIVKQVCELSAASESILKTAMERLNFSARAYDKILKVARTIADLAESQTIHEPHMHEAIQYRSLDRENYWGTKK